jgi:hypothetical protein
MPHSTKPPEKLATGELPGGSRSRLRRCGRPIPTGGARRLVAGPRVEMEVGGERLRPLLLEEGAPVLGRGPGDGGHDENAPLVDGTLEAGPVTRGQPQAAQGRLEALASAVGGRPLGQLDGEGAEGDGEPELGQADDGRPGEAGPQLGGHRLLAASVGDGTGGAGAGASGHLARVPCEQRELLLAPAPPPERSNRGFGPLRVGEEGHEKEVGRRLEGAHDVFTTMK